MRLSPHFTLEEMSFSETAARMGIDNTPPPAVVENLVRTADGLERVRQHLNANAIRISSGYRSPALERVLCADAFRGWCKRRGVAEDQAAWSDYLLTKQHPTGNAVDFTSPYGPPHLLVKVIRNSGIEYDQLILEYASWVHISFSDEPRKQTLVSDKLGTRLYV